MVKPMNILLVEDSPEDIDLTSEALKNRLSHHLTVIKDGKEALEYLKKEGHYAESTTPDVVILDIDLPRKNGLQILEEIKKDPNLWKMDIVLFTGTDMTDEMLQNYGVSRTQYVKKSANFEELIEHFNQKKSAAKKARIPETPTKIFKEKVKILIVEDNKNDVELIEELLVMKGKYSWELIHVETLTEAFDQLDKESFDAVVLDLFLPGSYGLETLRTLRKYKSKIPIVISSGLNDEQTAIEAVRQGAQDYLIKGQINADIFIRSIRYAMERAQLERVRDELIGYVNHELNNPLTVVKEAVSQIAEGMCGEINEKQKEYLNKSLSSINRLIRITDDLLETTMLEFGKTLLKKESFNIVELANSVFESMRTSSVKKDLEMRFVAPASEIKIRADKNRIEQVIINLLGNALKYTEKGSVELKLEEKDEEVQCTVEDTGPGIDDKDKDRLFKKFERLEQAQSTRLKGAGLGLYICRELIKVHHGRIWIESEVGRGSKFIFTLPKRSQ